jgi:hypothetical protein
MPREMAGLALTMIAGVTVLDERGHLNADESEGFILATYREIAAHFALSGPNAARTKVKRAGWSAAPTNHPADPLHIRVPRDAWYQAAESPHPKRTERPNTIIRDASPPKPDTPHIGALEAAISSLTERAGTAEKRADRAENRADRAEARADRAEQAIEVERNRADRAEQGRDALRDRLITMQEQLADAHGALQAAEATAARADRAERDKERAETGREAERARADALRERLKDTAAKLADAQTELAAAQDEADAATELRRELEAAQIAQGEAEADAAELKQANAERRARGLVARLRQAWRGQ